ncbi:TPA: hypothetical protein RZK27_001929, partial [Campylobacter coli]|nr:hypothetical protein [Campylobacter coli]
MLRDTKRDEAYFTKHIIECEEEIKEDEKILLELPFGKRETCLFCITDRKKCIAMDKYSRGDDINLVKKDLEALMLLRQKNRLELGGFDTSDYRGNAIELCVRVLLDMDSACVLELIEEDERKKKDIFNRDWFLHFMGSKG